MTRVLLDTNVLLRSVEPRHVHHQAAVDAIDVLRRAGHDMVIVPQVLYEFWSVATRPVEQNGLGMTPAEAHAQLTAIQRLFRLHRDERAICPIWEQLVSTLDVRGKQAHDARLAAAMQRHGVRYLLTFNAGDFTRYTFLMTLAPTAVVGGGAEIATNL